MRIVGDDSLARYRAVPFEKYSLGWEKELVKVLTDERSCLLPRATVMGMGLCRDFQTLAHHTKKLCKIFKTPESQTARIAQTLCELVAQGLLISEDCLYQNISASKGSPQAISSVVIITANRAGPCGNALTSFVENTTQFSRQTSFKVIDDSRSSDLRTPYLENMARCAGSNGKRAFYAGRQEKEAYIAELEGMGIEAAIARFVLLGENDDSLETIGANRNCALLDTLGECILSVDDDMVCRSTPHPHLSRQLRIASHVYPRDLWFFENREKVLSEVEWQSVDALQEHENMLGHSVGDLLLESKSRSGVTLEDTCDHVLVGMLSGTAVVTATFGGIAGDSGGCFAKWMLTCSGQTRVNLAKSKLAYDVAMRSREVLGVAPSPTVTHNAFCPGASFGLDNRTELPPFFPVSRGEDSVFGVLAMNSSRDCYFGHIPYAFLHNGALGRSYQPKPQFRIAELMMCLIAPCALPPGTSKASSFRLIGQYLEELAHLTEKDFWNCVCHMIRVQQATGMRTWQATLDTFDDCPDHWRMDLRDMQAHQAALLTNPANLIPSEYIERYPVDLAKAKTKELVRKTGEMLRAWPDILMAASELRRRSVRISAPLTELTVAA
jgi:hypothetical protein